MTTRTDARSGGGSVRQSLRQRASQVAKLVRDASEAVLILDLDGNILALNDVAVAKYGYAQRAAQRLTVQDLTPDIQKDLITTLLSRAAHGMPVESVPCQRVTKDGRELEMWLTITPLRLDSDLPVAVMTTETDIAHQGTTSVVRAQLLDGLLRTQEEERQRLAHELHDETGQLITSLLQKLQAVEEAQSLREVRAAAADIRDLAESVLREVKRISRGLRPGELDVLGLNEALQSFLEDFSQTYAITVDSHFQGLEGKRLPSRIEVCLYRIVQEALTNVARHANAENVSVVAMRIGEVVSLIIEDDGSGFDVDKKIGVNEPTGTFGLHGIRERARAVGGQATIESRPGHGTSIYVKIPVQHSGR